MLGFWISLLVTMIGGVILWLACTIFFSQLLGVMGFIVALMGFIYFIGAATKAWEEWWHQKLPH